jgi:hypothetical protein
MGIAEVRGRLFQCALARLMAINRRAGEEGAGGADAVAVASSPATVDHSVQSHGGS